MPGVPGSGTERPRGVDGLRMMIREAEGEVKRWERLVLGGVPSFLTAAPQVHLLAGGLEPSWL